MSVTTIITSAIMDIIGTDVTITTAITMTIGGINKGVEDGL